MTKSLKIGDKVMLIDNRIKAKVIFVGDRKVRVVDSNGFEHLLPIKKVVLLDEKTDTKRAYGNSFIVKDSDNKKGDKKSKLHFKDINLRENFKVDLHIENLTNYHHQMDNFEIVQIQLNYCKDKIELALNKHIGKMIIVHGIGEGVLKKEVHDLLRMYNLKFFESNNGGSTEVIL